MVTDLNEIVAGMKRDREKLQEKLARAEEEVERDRETITRLDEAIGALAPKASAGKRGRPRGTTEEVETAPASPRRKRRLSAAGLKRIKAAQKARWDEFHKNQKKGRKAAA